MKEKLLKVPEGDIAQLTQRLKEKGVRVLHRFGDTLVVEGEPASNLLAEVSPSIRAIPSEPPAEAAADVSDKEISLRAFQLRQTQGFRRSKSKRATEGDDWDSIFERM